MTITLNYNTRRGTSYRHCEGCGTHWRHSKDDIWSRYQPKRVHASLEEAKAALVNSNLLNRWRRKYRHMPHDLHVLIYYGLFAASRLTADEKALLINLKKGSRPGSKQTLDMPLKQKTPRKPRAPRQLAERKPAVRKPKTAPAKPTPMPAPKPELKPKTSTAPRLITPQAALKRPPPIRARLEDRRMERELCGHDPLFG